MHNARVYREGTNDKYVSFFTINPSDLKEEHETKK